MTETRRRSNGAPHIGLRLLLALAVMLTGITMGTERARAGARDVEVLMVRVGADETPEARACYGAFRGGLLRSNGGEVHLMSIPRDVLLRRLGEESVDGFVAWPKERFRGALEGRRADVLDALVMVDCSPSASRLDVVVFAGTARLASATPQRLSLRNTPIDRGAARLAGALVARWQMRGFSP